ncbi:uncharacterized protein YALI1_D21938g [Yarrowia lipolytica]|uniref:Uncharacterized protein n=1 Tax=Yarrowia lipolytica TaxID=4952 RepID=A0A1D8NF23_YARLL|nr:hypothetical protein YALI1_D21938g [Yarrowia lipolytica]
MVSNVAERNKWLYRSPQSPSASAVCVFLVRHGPPESPLPIYSPAQSSTLSDDAGYRNLCRGNADTPARVVAIATVHSSTCAMWPCRTLYPRSCSPTCPNPRAIVSGLRVSMRWHN